MREKQSHEHSQKLDMIYILVDMPAPAEQDLTIFQNTTDTWWIPEDSQLKDCENKKNKDEVISPNKTSYNDYMAEIWPKEYLFGTLLILSRSRKDVR